MESAITSLIAIAGTLLGVAASYVFQLRSARQARRFAREDRLWQERLTAYSAFAEAVTAFRKSQNDRWHQAQENPATSAALAARDESYHQRANATAALFRLRLVCTDESLRDAASLALRLTEELHEAADEADRTVQGRKARRALRDFVEAANTQMVSIG